MDDNEKAADERAARVVDAAVINEALFEANQEMGAGLAEIRVELETLRGIAKRLADGWVPIEVMREWATVITYRPWDCQDREPMTQAEQRAIYGAPARKIKDNPQA